MRFAVDGGTPRFPEHLRYNCASLPEGSTLLPRLESILNSGRLNKGPWISHFEQMMAEFAGTREAVLFSSGSTALTLLIRALRPEGPVVLPAFLFPPVAHALRNAPCDPLFADVSASRWTMGGVEAAEAMEGRRASMIVGFHPFGLPAPAGELEALAADRGVPVIFDAAHAFGAELHGRRCGSFGVAEVFSLTPSKLVTGGEGGVITTSDRSLAGELKSLRNYGKDEGGERFPRLGMSARPTEIAACLASASLEILPREIERRGELIEEYSASLSGIDGVDLAEHATGALSAPHEFPIRIDEAQFGLSRDELRPLLAAEGVETRDFYRIPAHRSPAGGRDEPPVHCPVTERLARELMQLPLSTDVKRGDPAAIAGLLGEMQLHRPGGRNCREGSDPR